MGVPTVHSKHGVWVGSCDGYVSYTASGTRRRSHHEIVYLGGSWHTTTCLSKTLKEHDHAKEQLKGKTLKEHPKEKPIEECTLAEVALKDKAKSNSMSSSGQTMVADPTLAALLAPNAPDSSETTPSEDISAAAASDAAVPKVDVEAEPQSSQHGKAVVDQQVEGSSKTTTPVKQTSAPKRAAPGSDASPETPDNKMAKPYFGGNQTRAQECVICERPRDRGQPGRACPTCQSIMRGRGQRSIEVVLADKDLCKVIREQSLEAKPIDNPDDSDPQVQIDQIEKLLKNLKRLKRMSK